MISWPSIAVAELVAEHLVRILSGMLLDILIRRHDDEATSVSDFLK
jgi:hypothetical protein